MIQDETISAVATVFGEAGIGIIRMSGIKAIEIADKIFKSTNGKKVSTIKDRSIIFGHIVDNRNNIIDEVIVLLMRAPKSYTREDVIEIQCHSGILVLQKVLARTLEAGARLAERGEFTKRAFLNGRLDLSQAQSILDIIQARTDDALQMAENKLSGKIKDQIYDLRQHLLQSVAHIEAVIDFPEEDIDNIVVDEINNNIKQSIDKLNDILESETKSKILNSGIKTAIIGKPNVGKSSLLNLLTETEKAIVTDIPGTTRDIIEEYVNICGIPFKIIDTAGIHNSSDKIENIGITKAKECAQEADLILALFDGSRSLDSQDEEIFDLIKKRNAIILITKSDLPKVINLNPIKTQFISTKIINISVKNETGINELKEDIKTNINQISSELLFIKSAREIDILKRVEKHLEEAKNTLNLNIGIDFVSIDLRAALRLLDELTGEIVDEDIINEIFSKFCIGK